MFGNFSFKTPSLGQFSVPNSFVSLFVFYILSYLLSKTMGCLSGCLMSSASIQKLFCGICLVFKCSFDEFVGEKVVSPSYSSAILGPPLSFTFFYLHIHTSIHPSVFIGEGNGTPLQYSCLENPMDGGAWWAAVHGVAKSRTRLKQLHFHCSLSCIGEGNGNPLQCSCLENPRDGGAWWAVVYGVAQSRTRLK